MGSDYSEPEAKEPSPNRKNSCSRPVHMLEKLVTMNTTKTEIEAVQFRNDKSLWIQYVCSSAGRGI